MKRTLLISLSITLMFVVSNAHALTYVSYNSHHWGSIQSGSWGTVNHIGKHCRDENCNTFEIYVARCPAKFNQKMQCELIALGTPDHFCDLKLTDQILKNEGYSMLWKSAIGAFLMTLIGPLAKTVIGEQTLQTISSLNSAREIVEDAKNPKKNLFGCYDHSDDLLEEKASAKDYTAETIEKSNLDTVKVTRMMGEEDQLAGEFRFLISPLTGDRTTARATDKQNFYKGTVTATLTCNKFITGVDGKKICDPNSQLSFKSEFVGKPFALQMQEHREAIRDLERRAAEEDRSCKIENAVASDKPRPLWGTSCPVQKEIVIAKKKEAPVAARVQHALAKAIIEKPPHRRAQDLDDDTISNPHIIQANYQAAKAPGVIKTAEIEQTSKGCFFCFTPAR